MRIMLALLLIAGLLLAACQPAATLTPEQATAASAASTALPAATRTATPAAPSAATATASPTYTTTPTTTPTETPRPTATRTPSASYSDPLYLTQHLDGELGDAIIPAPEMDGLTMRQGEDGMSVEYINPQGDVVLVAEARKLDFNDKEGELLGDVMYEVYEGNGVYVRYGVFPRFRFPMKGFEAGFFGLDQTMTYSQIQRIQETLEIFDRSEFSALKPYIFNPEVTYIVLETLGWNNLGANFIGTKVVILDRQYLFGNGYLLASVIAHEGAHTLQGKINLNHECEEKLRDEVGDQTIAPDFESWEAERLMEGVKEGTVGAYHVSYWVLARLGFDNLYFFQKIIQTGRFDGQPLIDNCR